MSNWREREKEVESLIEMYSNGYKHTLKELQDKHDDIIAHIREGNVSSIEITINIEACEIPSYNIKYNYIPDLSKPL